MRTDILAGFSYDSLARRVVFGAGAARHGLRAEVERLGAERLLLITTERARGLVAELTAPFAARVAATFTAVRQHVPVANAEQARAAAADAGADALLCVGGGSTTGTAKAVAVTTGLPIIAVPTTYSGSEITPAWGTTEGGRKTVGVDPAVAPRVVVYDPELTASMAADLAAASGLNAMAHCVEAFWGPRRNPVSTVLAEEGVRALGDGLRGLAAGPSGDAHTAAHGDLLYGAYLAGEALAGAGHGLHHKICHALGGAFDLPHAQTHAIVLPHVLAANAPGAPDAVERISRALGVADPVAGLTALGRALGIPPGLAAVGLRREQVDEAAAILAPAVPAENPVPIDVEGLRALLRAAWAG